MPFLVLLLVGGTLFGVVTAAYTIRLRKGLIAHQDMSRKSFLDYFAHRGISKEAAAAVYDYYSSQLRLKTCGVSPADDIGALFHQEGEDTAEDFAHILKSLGLEMPYDSAWNLHNDQPVQTVEDLVRIVAWAGQNQPPHTTGNVAGMY